MTMDMPGSSPAAASGTFQDIWSAISAPFRSQPSVDLPEVVAHLDPGLLAHAVRFFPAREAAMKAGPAPVLRRIFTLEAGDLVIRGPNQTNDPLFERFPRWGASARIPLAELATGSIDGQVAPSIADQIVLISALNPAAFQTRTPRGQAIPAACGLVVTHVPRLRVWLPEDGPRGGQETNRRLQDKDGRWWLRVDLAEPEDDNGEERALASTFRPGPGDAALTVEEGWLVRRSRSSRFAALYEREPLWGVETAYALDGVPVRPTVVGEPRAGDLLSVDPGRSTDLIADIQWQRHDTGLGQDGWTPLAGARSSSVQLGAEHRGAWLRARLRGPATAWRWVVSNVVGPVQAMAPVAPEPCHLGRRPAPLSHAALQALAAAPGQPAAPAPLDLYRDPDFHPGTGWLGHVATDGPPSAASLQTTYTPGENVIHPCIVELPVDLCGYRYLCAITAYPRGPALEDPFLYGSNDRLTWTLLADVPQPLDVRKPVTGAYNSDTFITHDPVAGVLVVAWRAYEPRSEGDRGPANSDVVLRCRTTPDGHGWSEPIDLMRLPADRNIMLSPTMIYDPEAGLWHMWTIDRPVMHHWTAPTLQGPWTLDAAQTPLSVFRMAHHHEVKWVGDRLVCLLYSRQDGNLYFGIFKPGSWTEVDWSLAPLLHPRPACLYKASFVPVHDPVAGTLAFDLWWTRGAACPTGGIDAGHGRKLQYARTVPVAI
ncbi:hypothetical protein E4L95_01245 [Paracoccus liaowanqingii]|uniref:Uncharacterized protein n=1 Tax=Paracoccus liaowanqingii TaxID=2560053 RepID=A0A4Z1CSU9_9RHOB|nr:hypothetical protein [Paracoccus liaowanqingii]TGN68422.1 hypothetical protein E4L95_01245 [Paracoccus liaowanqingii]